jgi:hypothetical protein
MRNTDFQSLSHTLLCAATGWSLATAPPSQIDALVFAIACGGDASASTSSSFSELNGVLLAALRDGGGGATGQVPGVSSEVFVLRDKRSRSDMWTFPCLEAASAAHSVSPAPLALMHIALWFVAALAV